MKPVPTGQQGNRRASRFTHWRDDLERRDVDNLLWICSASFPFWAGFFYEAQILEAICFKIC